MGDSASIIEGQYLHALSEGAMQVNGHAHDEPNSEDIQAPSGRPSIVHYMEVGYKPSTLSS